jgi:hypothetical protein
MRKLIRSLVPAACIATSLLSMPLIAEENKSIDIASYLCKDIMRWDGEARGVSLGVLHGYVMGKKGVTSADYDKVEALSNDFIEHCLDNPHDNALAAFEKLAK